MLSRRRDEDRARAYEAYQRERKLESDEPRTVPLPPWYDELVNEKYAAYLGYERAKFFGIPSKIAIRFVAIEDEINEVTQTSTIAA
jgi:hypothetical protein